MEDISLYFEPGAFAHDGESFEPGQLGASVIFHDIDLFPDTEQIQIAIFGVPESRNAAGSPDTSFSADAIRPWLYRLYNHFPQMAIADLGNLKQGHTPDDTMEAVSEVVAALLRQHVMPVMIGGSQDLTFGAYLAYEKCNRIINILSVDSRFDIGKAGSSFSHKTWLNRIVFREPNFLFNYSALGYQSYLVDQEAVSLMKKLFFDATRLGIARADMSENEPLIRNADVFSFDMSSIKAADGPANSDPSPNGFTGDEACQLMRYAGMSEKLSFAGVFEHVPSDDTDGRSAHLAAQMIWYFIDGYASRKGDDPHMNKASLIKYIVSMHDTNSDIAFYRSPVSDRWWMEVPCPNNLLQRFERHYMVPCSYKDYQDALEERLPDRWWQTFQKFM